MPLEAEKLLFDIDRAAALIGKFLAGKGYADYEKDDLLRSGVERQFEIIGEALNRLTKIDEETAKRISDYPRIVAFRNILIHGYAEIDDRLVWNVIETKLPTLIQEVRELTSSQ